MDRFEFTTAKLMPGEELIAKQKAIRLYDGDAKTSYEGGDMWLTSHRLLWGKTIFLNSDNYCIGLQLSYVIFAELDPAGFAALSRSDKIILHLVQARPDKPAGPVERSKAHYMKLSFREGGASNFFVALGVSLQKKEWEKTLPSQPTSAAPAYRIRTGIVGIERKIQEKQKETDENISMAFEDLGKLMNMAKDMVSLSKNMSRKIMDKQGHVSEDETVQFKSYLLSMGITDPVTKQAYGSGDAYHKELAREVSKILLTPVKEAGGMMALTDAYCIVNRARGMELLSPEDLLHACQVLESLKLPLRLRIFESGVKVLQLETHSDDAVVGNTMSLIEKSGSLTSDELAQIVGISVILAKERLLVCEREGQVCRDESIEGLRFYPNMFLTLE